VRETVAALAVTMREELDAVHEKIEREMESLETEMDQRCPMPPSLDEQLMSIIESPVPPEREPNDEYSGDALKLAYYPEPEPEPEPESNPQPEPEPVQPTSFPRKMAKAGAHRGQQSAVSSTTALNPIAVQRARRFSAMSGAPIEVGVDGSSVKVSNPFLEVLEESTPFQNYARIQEEDSHAPEEAGVAELTFELRRGSKGFGMAIADSMHVLEIVAGLPAEQAGVPVPCKIVSVNSVQVTSKAALSLAVREGGEVTTFVVLAKRKLSKQAQAVVLLARSEVELGESLYGDAMSTLIDAANLDPQVRD